MACFAKEVLAVPQTRMRLTDGDGMHYLWKAAPTRASMYSWLSFGPPAQQRHVLQRP
jgi:hypothetical protein